MSPATATTPRMDVDAERIWDLGYELLELHVSGVFCDIWRIRRRGTDLIFGWKQLRREWYQNSQARQALENEAAVAQLVRSPYLPHILDMHVETAPYYLMFDWFAGDTLENWIHWHSPLSVRLSLWIARQCAQALDDLLQAGLMHGDLRLSNVLINPSGNIQFNDLSSSRRAPVATTGNLETRSSGASGPLQDYDSVVRQTTPPMGIAKDLHGVGMILFQCLTGHSPFDAVSAADLVRQHHGKSSEMDVRSHRPEISDAVAEFTAALLSRASQQSRSLSLATVVDQLSELEIAEFLR